MKIKKIWDGKKNEEKPGDLNSPISAISKASFFGQEALKMIPQQIEKLKTN